MLKTIAGPGLIALSIMVTGLGATWIYTERMQPPVIPGPNPAPNPNIVVVDDLQGLDTALAAEGNPDRVIMLRDLFAGMAIAFPRSNCNSLIQVQTANKMAGEILGLEATNKEARAIIVAAFEKLMGEIENPLDQADLDRVGNFYQALSDKAAKAL